MAGVPGEVTLLLAEIRMGHRDALTRLIPLVYGELRRLAGCYLRDARIGHTLEPAALVHEAYLRLAGPDRAKWQNRAQFMTIAAQLMRRILVDYARQRATGTRGGAAVRLDDETFHATASPQSLDTVLAVNEALVTLEHVDPRQARMVEMRYFAGLSVEETAEALGVSPPTVMREWALAKAWLRTRLSGESPT